MAATQNYLALDLGAESGRAILGQFDGKKFTLSEVHRFPNFPISMPQKHGGSSLRWDILRLWSEVKEGILRITRKQGKTITAIGVDTWGVDFGLFDEKGAIISAPYAYRDKRTDGMMEKAFERLSREHIFEQTGIQFLQLNSLYQLLAMVLDNAPEFKIAKTRLTVFNVSIFSLFLNFNNHEYATFNFEKSPFFRSIFNKYFFCIYFILGSSL